MTKLGKLGYKIVCVCVCFVRVCVCFFFFFKSKQSFLLRECSDKRNSDIRNRIYRFRGVSNILEFYCIDSLSVCLLLLFFLFVCFLYFLFVCLFVVVVVVVFLFVCCFFFGGVR